MKARKGNNRNEVWTNQYQMLHNQFLSDRYLILQCGEVWYFRMIISDFDTTHAVLSGKCGDKLLTVNRLRLPCFPACSIDTIEMLDYVNSIVKVSLNKNVIRAINVFFFFFFFFFFFLESVLRRPTPFTCRSPGLKVYVFL